MDRSWIMNPNRVALEYIRGLNQFLDFANNHMTTENLSKIRCPCQKCRNLFKFQLNQVRGHLYRFGFDKMYLVWTFHGEADRPFDDGNPNNDIDYMSDVEEEDSFFDMLNDLRDAEMASGSVGVGEIMTDDDIEATSQKGAEGYMSMFEEAQLELYPGCTSFSAFIAS